jgi:hypothetical protein
MFSAIRKKDTHTDVELLLGALADLAAEVAEVQQLHVEDVLEAEVVAAGLHGEAHLVADLLPVALLHAVLPEILRVRVENLSATISGTLGRNWSSCCLMVSVILHMGSMSRSLK